LRDRIKAKSYFLSKAPSPLEQKSRTLDI